LPENRAKQAGYRASNAETLKTKQNEYRAKNRADKAAYDRLYRDLNHAKKIAKGRAYYLRRSLLRLRKENRPTKGAT
jgi:predicted  nucleic acid-binding Zn-ribbon protein